MKKLVLLSAALLAASSLALANETPNSNQNDILQTLPQNPTIQVADANTTAPAANEQSGKESMGAATGEPSEKVVKKHHHKTKHKKHKKCCCNHKSPPK
jgi:hypothetical protein